MPLRRMLRRFLWVWGFFAVLLLLVVVLGFLRPAAPASTVRIVDPSGVAIALDVEFATTPEQRTVGLMHRPTVDRGMLFVFDDEAPRSFWMKNTLVPLDIAYFRADGAWVSSARMEPCAADPCRTYESAGPARYALELPAGGLGASIGSGWTLRSDR